MPYEEPKLAAITVVGDQNRHNPKKYTLDPRPTGSAMIKRATASISEPKRSPTYQTIKEKPIRDRP
jgi:hypothetical protein